MLIIIYLILGYWATGVTIYANRVVIHSFGQLFIQKIVLAFLLGWLLIPWAIIKKIANKA